MDKTSIGNRMKSYEAVSKNFLMKKVPVIIRLDGKAFHTFTRGFDKPFDDIIEYAMQTTTLELCKTIQNVVLGYTQSDEITLVLCDYQKIDTSAWYEYNVQKMCSVASSIATLAFSKALHIYSEELRRTNDIKFIDKAKFIDKKLEKGAFFDARCFNIPKDEVINCLIWRQQDATRNSIQALAQSLFPHKELQGLSCNQLQDKVFIEKGINWNNLSAYQKRGACAIKKLVSEAKPSDNEVGFEMVQRLKWRIDRDTPIFTQERDYINSKINFD